jgi:hypothetical protein
MNRFFIVLCVLFLQANAIVLPKGWIYPKDLIFLSKWRDRDPNKYLKCSGDFNGDGIVDTAMILQREKGLGMGIFVCLSNSQNAPLMISLYESEADKANIVPGKPDVTEKVLISYRSRYGISTAKPGVYITACGRGFYDCRKNEPEKIRLVAPAIRFFEYDAGYEEFFYWDAKAKKFINQQMSD